MSGEITLQMSMQEYYKLNEKRFCYITVGDQTYKIVLDLPKEKSDG